MISCSLKPPDLLRSTVLDCIPAEHRSLFVIDYFVNEACHMNKLTNASIVIEGLDWT